jgi:hypothetical protein
MDIRAEARPRALGELAAFAPQACISEVIAEVFGSNCGMLNVFQKSGLQMSTKRESPVTHVTLKFVCA